MFKNTLITVLFSFLFIHNNLVQSQNISGAPPKEYEIKAAFVYNFIKFVEWPEEITELYPEISIAILGRDPFGETLDNLIKGKSIKDKKLSVYRYSDIEDIHFCHVLFISKSEEKNLKLIFAHLKEKSILTVGESSDFLKHGGIIKLLEKDNRVRFEINLQQANASRLKISSRLLRLAENLKDVIAFLFKKPQFLSDPSQTTH